MVKFL